MDLTEIRAEVADQERGRWLELVDPVEGTPLDIHFRLAGPDSATQHKAQLRLADDIAEIADADGTVSAEKREKLRLQCLAACVLDWRITEDGEAVPFTTANVVRVLRSASWLQAQIDSFASDRAAFRRDD